MTRDDLKSAMQEAIREEFGPLFIEREEHFKHHAFLKNFISTADKIRGTACRTVTVGVITAIFTLLVLGFRGWIKEIFSFIGGKH
jgi:hypothetical protein